MNPRTLKEIRSLLPVFTITALILLLEGRVLGREYVFGIALVTFCAGCAFLGAGSFGEEFQSRTMSLLLTQPVPRGKVWREKMLALGIALAAFEAVFLVCIGVPYNSHDEPMLYLVLGLVPLWAFCGGPGQALTMKNTLMGALTTFALPLVVWMGLAACWGLALRLLPSATVVAAQKLLEENGAVYLAGLAGFCSVVACRTGYRWFVGLQMIDAQAREIRLPGRMEALLARPVLNLIPGYTSELASLFRKELELQRTSYLIAVVLFLTAPIEVLVWALHRSELTMVLPIANVVLCVVMIPLITAGVSVAEERSLGVLGWQLCLPPSPLKQWLVKLLTVLGTSVLLGIVLPAVMLIAGHWIFHYPMHGGLPLPHDWPSLLVDVYCVLGYLLLLSLFVFASSVSTSSFRALLLGIGLMIACGSAALWPVRSWAVASFENRAVASQQTDAKVASILHPGRGMQLRNAMNPNFPGSNNADRDEMFVIGPAGGPTMMQSDDSQGREQLVTILVAVFALYLTAVLVFSLLRAYRNFQNVDASSGHRWTQSLFIVLLFSLLGVLIYARPFLFFD